MEVKKPMMSPARPESKPVAGQKSHAAPPSQGSVSISYDAHLITQLKKDHEHLLNEFKQINLLIQDNRFEEGLNTLVTFRSRLLNHLHLENLKLYIYLQYALKDKPEEFTKMRLFRKEMDAIGKVALEFFAKYDDEKISYANKAAFLSELTMVGNVLGKRIEQEESRLYTMYKELA